MSTSRSASWTGSWPSSACGKRFAPDVVTARSRGFHRIYLSFFRNERSFQLTLQEPPMSNSKIVLITGATAGIGRTTALHLAKLGHHVIASGRKAAELTKLETEGKGLGGKLEVITLDVTSTVSIAAAALAVGKLTGGQGPDVLINNAGFGVLGPTSEISDADMRRQYETNVFGLM